MHEKARDNIAAIRTLKQLESENRDATDAEKAVLARYAGWGAIPNAFAYAPPSEWKSVARELKQILTDDEYASARASTPNAHFTSPTVITAVWDALQHLGLEPGAQILEPSMGVGHFFDAILGNVPFGDYGVHDPAYKKPQTRAIHDYFFAKSIDKLRPGAVMALITSRYTMDKQDGAMRRYLAERADLLGAIRLPNTAFKANAGTEVTTDILFLQKRPPGRAPSGPAWTELAAIDTPDGAIEVN